MGTFLVILALLAFGAIAWYFIGKDEDDDFGGSSGGGYGGGGRRDEGRTQEK